MGILDIFGYFWVFLDTFGFFWFFLGISDTFDSKIRTEPNQNRTEFSFGFKRLLFSKTEKTKNRTELNRITEVPGLDFTFKEAWFHLYDEYPVKYEADRLPPPIVDDLNGDGKKEVLVATNDAKIQEDFPHNAHHREIAISISNYTLKHGYCWWTDGAVAKCM